MLVKAELFFRPLDDDRKKEASFENKNSIQTEKEDINDIPYEKAIKVDQRRFFTLLLNNINSKLELLQILFYRKNLISLLLIYHYIF